MPIQMGPPTLPKPKPAPALGGSFPTPIVNGQPVLHAPGQQAPAQAAAPVASAMTSNPFDTDAAYLAALAAEQAGSQQLDASLRAAQMQAIVQFGDPSLAQAGGFDLDPLTAAMAQQNTQAGNSTLAQLQRQRDQNQQGIQNQLAAHGMIYSGSLGQQTGQNQQQYGTELYNQQQSVLQALAGISRDTLAQKQGLHSQTVSALTSSYDRAISNPQFWGAAGTVDDGGAKGLANTQAVAPVTAGLAGGGGKKPSSKLAVKSPPNPFAARTARQTVGMG